MFDVRELSEIETRGKALVLRCILWLVPSCECNVGNFQIPRPIGIVLVALIA